MRLRPVACALVALIALCAGCKGGAKAPARPVFVPGMAVAAPWHGALHLGTVASVDGPVVNVRFAFDGQVRMVKELAVRLVAPRQWRTGDRVLAAPRGDRFDPGTVVIAKPGAYTIKWQDESPPSDVPADRILAP